MTLLEKIFEGNCVLAVAAAVGMSEIGRLTAVAGSSWDYPFWPHFQAPVSSPLAPLRVHNF